ncbi:hypothetical protein CGLO_03465 [Colletotrichum gloeosporioides Cg-14]|uniref:Uncharacterized protein n=1 Tax=Colletotrichum gloeosporioides (strain Cg-14) TaxID=1237896 RepID=T0KLN5_COLGC|nr:hypothetical protein CGLO_03465 [Colletotrichum gloeosporioides Cg-14]
MADAAEDWSVWLYEPSLALAIVGTIVYTAVFVWVTFGADTVEFADDPEGYTMTHEWMFWVFEWITMVVAIAVFCVWHPGKHLDRFGEREKQASTPREEIIRSQQDT